jgi:hypothetical protein
MTTSLGQPRLALPVGSGSDAANSAASIVVPPTLVDQLADALGVAESRCAEQRIRIQPVSCQPSLRVAAPYMPPSFINAETAPFLVQAGSHDRSANDRGPASTLAELLAQPPSMQPPQPPPLPSPSHADALSTLHVFSDPAYSRFAEPGPQTFDSEHDDAADLPRFFDPGRQALPRQVHQPSQQLSAGTMALGFAIGLAVIAPTMWLASAEKISAASKRVTASAVGLTTPMLTASTVATLIPAAAFEVAERGGKEPTEAERLELAEVAFLEASRRIAAGDYIGARDQLRQALAFGEERARALLDGLQ